MVLNLLGKDIEGITYTSVSYCFDNTEKELLITGSLPDGVSVEYSNNKGTNAGTYNAQAVMSGEGYKTKTLSATLTITKATYDMLNAKWDYTSAYTYDGSEKSVVITGLPSGVTVNQYSNNAKTNAGSYVATASLSFDQTNYNASSIGNCSWKIEKADISGITYTSVSYCFDNTEKELLITGSLPDGVSVEYSNNKGTNAGTYNAQAVMSGEGYKTKTLSATLTITKATYDMLNAKWDYTSAYTYDGSEKSVVITGLPSGVTVNQYSNNAKTNAGGYVA